MNSPSRAAITTHILDTERGRPVAQVKVTLCQRQGDALKLINHATTNEDGRVEQWHQPLAVTEGEYQLTFDVQSYFASLGVASFYPSVAIHFHVNDSQQHYHVPLLLAAHGYSTYRGS